MYAVKLHGGPYQAAGLPDILAVWYGQAIGIEVKCPGNTATPLQLAVHDKLRRAGALVTVARSVAEVVEFIDQCHKDMGLGLVTQEEPEPSHPTHGLTDE